MAFMVNLAGVTLADETIVSTTNVVNLNTSTSPQPTSGNRWLWDADTHSIYRTLDGTGGYVRADDTGTFGGGFRSFDWSGPGGGPSALATLTQVRGAGDSQRGGAQLLTDGRIVVTYGSGTIGVTVVDMDSQAAGRYYVETLVKLVDTTGYVKVNVYNAALSLVASAQNTGLSLADTGVHVRHGNATGYTTDRMGGWFGAGCLTEGQTFLSIIPPPTAVIQYSPDGTTRVPAYLYYTPDGTTLVPVTLT